MDLLAFTLHAEPPRRKFYRPKPVLTLSFTQSSSCIWGQACFWRGLYVQQVGFGAVCVRISMLRLNFIRLRSATVRFIRRVNANLAQIPLAFVSLVRVLFAPDAVCVRIAANFVKFYNKGQRCKI